MMALPFRGNPLTVSVTSCPSRRSVVGVTLREGRFAAAVASSDWACVSSGPGAEQPLQASTKSNVV
jgi:hypothetical protein